MSTRLVMLTTNLAPGGAEAQVAQLARGFARRGFRTSVVSLLPPAAFADELKAAGVGVYSLDMRPGSPNPIGAVRLLAALRRLRPQVLHAHMFHANLMARLARIFCPVPAVISTAHSLIESSRRSEDARARERLYRLTDRLGDITVVVSKAGADRYARIGAAPSHRLRVIPNGVDTRLYHPPAAPRDSNDFVWLAAGRLMWKKDYPNLIDAFTRVGRGSLWIAGSGPQEAELRQLATQSAARIRFLGQRSDLPALLHEADAFVLSSVVEGLPMVLLEAAASGLPCVTTGAGGASEVVLDGETGFVVPPGDAAALAAAMTRIMEMPAGQRLRLGEAARRHAVARFGIEAVLDQWELLYRELLGR
ncbi:MAG: glycosyltransferase [Bryobacteraceae bacterium]